MCFSCVLAIFSYMFYLFIYLSVLFKAELLFDTNLSVWVWADFFFFLIFSVSLGWSLKKVLLKRIYFALCFLWDFFLFSWVWVLFERIPFVLCLSFLWFFFILSLRGFELKFCLGEKNPCLREYTSWILAGIIRVWIFFIFQIT